MGNEGRLRLVRDTAGPGFGLSILRRVGHLAGVAMIVGLLPIALWATSSAGIASREGPPEVDDHGISELTLDARERTWLTCMTAQLDGDETWDTEYTVLEVGEEGTVIQPRGWRSAINGVATIVVVDGHLEVVDRKGSRYFEPTECRW